MSALDPPLAGYLAGFTEDPGYLDYGRIGPVSRAVVAETRGQTEILARARFGSLDHFGAQDLRMRAVVAAGLGFRSDQVVSQPNTSMGLMHAMFGLTGDVLLSPADFPSVPFAAVRIRRSCSSKWPRLPYRARLSTSVWPRVSAATARERGPIRP